MPRYVSLKYPVVTLTPPVLLCYMYQEETVLFNFRFFGRFVSLYSWRGGSKNKTLDKKVLKMSLNRYEKQKRRSGSKKNKRKRLIADIYPIHLRYKPIALLFSPESKFDFQ